MTLKHYLDNDKPLTWGVRDVVHAHLGREPIDLIRDLADKNPTIVPLRDPLASLVTWRHRHPNGEDSFILRGWEDLLKLEGRRIPFYVPLDITRFHVERGQALYGVLNKAGAKADRKVIEDWVRRWPHVSSKGEYPLKRLYQSKSVQALNMDEEIEGLRKIEGLRQFLLKRGYRNLIW